MKYTTNFIVYLNDEGKVHCAKCKMTGRFVKRAIAQNEYDLEYVYKVTFKGFISFMFTVFLVLLTFKQVKKTAKKLDQINNEITGIYQVIIERACNYSFTPDYVSKGYKSYSGALNHFNKVLLKYKA